MVTVLWEICGSNARLMLVVLRAAMEVEGLVWRDYDEVFRVKMAAMCIE